eukprot:11231582-Prorocentrum_lima.AAC.1
MLRRGPSAAKDRIGAPGYFSRSIRLPFFSGMLSGIAQGMRILEQSIMGNLRSLTIFRSSSCRSL